MSFSGHFARSGGQRAESGFLQPEIQRKPLKRRKSSADSWRIGTTRQRERANFRSHRQRLQRGGRGLVRQGPEDAGEEVSSQCGQD